MIDWEWIVVAVSITDMKQMLQKKIERLFHRITNVYDVAVQRKRSLTIPLFQEQSAEIR
jgi:hypothetical protein